MKRNILLNPGPATTTDTVKYAMVVPDICPREKEFGQLLDSIKEDLPKVVNGGDAYTSVIFAASGTGAMEASITSAVPKGKKLLVVENGAYGTRMVKIAETYQIEVVRYQLAYGDYPSVEAIEQLLKKHEGEISHLAVIHHETTTGMLNPVGEICQLAQRYGVGVIVDAMSSYAGIPIDIQAWKADYLISSSNKCIQGMAGMSFVIFKKELLEKIKGNKRSYYFDIYSQYMGFEQTGQMQFTPPVQVVYALRQAINEYFAETGAKRWERYQENWNTLYNGLKEIGFKFLLPFEQESKILLAIQEPNDERFNFDLMHDYLYERGFTIYPGKGAKSATFRISVLGDLYKKDIEAFLFTLKEYLREAKVNV
jgi:2-aminoethylphosphonate aminotransferase